MFFIGLIPLTSGFEEMLVLGVHVLTFELTALLKYDF
jgi:hypothetical protein